MTKEEKIKEAYGLYWKDYGRLTDENGFIYQSDLFYPDTEMKKEGIEIQVISVEIKHKWSNIKWRPKSLSGIEDNNGWINLPLKEFLSTGFYFIRLYVPQTKIESYIVHEVNENDSGMLGYHYATHYKPIEFNPIIY